MTGWQQESSQPSTRTQSILSMQVEPTTSSCLSAEHSQEEHKHPEVSREGSSKARKYLPRKRKAEARVGHWSEDEQKKYYIFLERYHDKFSDKKCRRHDKIFRIMAEFIGTREADQCRSHHQKIEKKYHSFEDIITHLRLRFYSSVQHPQLHTDLGVFDLEPGFQIFQLDTPSLPTLTLTPPEPQPHSQPQPAVLETAKEEKFCLPDKFNLENYSPNLSLIYKLENPEEPVDDLQL